ncbi:MAG: uroporphyrinogen decarboxylase family protein [Bryobacteraceae bacterium]
MTIVAFHVNNNAGGCDPRFMTEHQRILKSIRGEAVDRVPWLPRLEFWHRAALRAGTLPAEFEGLTPRQLARELGAACYAVVPDFTEAGESGMLDRGLGIYRIPTLSYRADLRDVERRISRNGRETVVEYPTPRGVLRTAFLFTDEMLDAGASMPWVTETLIQKPEDFEAAGYLFEHLEVTPQPDGYRMLRERVGEDGVAVAWVMGTASPMHHIMKELMPTEQFFYALADCPDRVLRLAERMEPFFAGIRQAALDSPAELVMLGGNYDDSITSPPFFRRWILPALRSYAEQLHERGKHLVTHTDGENRLLLPAYLETGFDVADSVCPHPMTRCTLDQLMTAFAGRITIVGGIPAVLLCPSSASYADFRHWIDDVIKRYGHAARLVLGVSDMVTADADLDRIRYIGEAIQTIHS